ncbi:MAG: hypothetical protein AAFU67_07405 [Bacteroidota bacterium]
MLFEEANKSKADRMLEGESITFRMQGDNFWQSGLITELRPDIQAMIINERYIMLEEIETVRFSGSRLANGVGYSLMTFGLGWSAFALIGYNTDGDPETQYSNSDLGVTLVAFGTGFLLRKLFANRKYKLSKRKRLRVVDLTF